MVEIIQYNYFQKCLETISYIISSQLIYDFTIRGSQERTTRLILGSTKSAELSVVVFICAINVTIGRGPWATAFLVISTPAIGLWFGLWSSLAVQVLQKPLVEIPKSSNFQVATISGLLIETFFAMCLGLTKVRLRAVNRPRKLVALIIKCVTYTGDINIIISFAIVMINK
ncbi:hypothetical protein K435DRAFT_791637 [Dendrothele bispora CBS 962.96]|uniref:Uncharacterized protein n=1 Tax=Dendrothele bispora (strain CBS 962.96) TaxID=1314807 RepID=A0A4S8MLI9_DENBC|nr:hypothetical protein K435DRAFT_791637 [Dendrothele bispora CBS 962.96]